jgi:hypothetical protein
MSARARLLSARAASAWVRAAHRMIAPGPTPGGLPPGTGPTAAAGGAFVSWFHHARTARLGLSDWRTHASSFDLHANW